MPETTTSALFHTHSIPLRKREKRNEKREVKILEGGEIIASSDRSKLIISVAGNSLPRSDASNIHKTRASNFSFFFFWVSGTWARNKNCNKRGEPCFRAFQRMKNGWMIRELGDIISSMVYGPSLPPRPRRCVRQLSETMIIGEPCSPIFDEC